MQLPNTLALFMYILLNAQHGKRKVGTPTGVIQLERGQFMSGRIALANKLKQSQQQIRTSLDRLVNLEIITIQSTNKYSIYTIENYDKYQDSKIESTSSLTNSQPTDNQQITTKQEFNNLSTKEKTSAHAIACPFDELINAYHVNMPSNPRCKVLNDGRKKMIKARWDQASKLDHLPFGYKTAQDGIAAWISFFRICNKSKYLTGQVPNHDDRPSFIADIDFLFSPSGFAKCLENKYHREAA